MRSRIFALIVAALLAAAPSVFAQASKLGSVSLIIGGLEVASFTEIGSIAGAVEVQEVQGGGPMPGSKSVAVTLSRPVSASIEMSAWHEQVMAGNLAAARKDVSIVARDHGGAVMAQYHLTGAWPAKVEITGRKSGRFVVPMETVTLVADFIQRVAP